MREDGSCSSPNFDSLGLSQTRPHGVLGRPRATVVRRPRFTVYTRVARVDRWVDGLPRRNNNPDLDTRRRRIVLHASRGRDFTVRVSSKRGEEAVLGVLGV